MNHSSSCLSSDSTVAKWMRELNPNCRSMNTSVNNNASTHPFYYYHLDPFILFVHWESNEIWTQDYLLQWHVHYQLIAIILYLLPFRSWGRILECIWDRSQEFSSLLFTVTSTNRSNPPPPFEQSGLKLVCYVNIVYGNLKSKNSQRNCTFMNSASAPFFTTDVIVPLKVG